MACTGAGGGGGGIAPSLLDADMQACTLRWRYRGVVIVSIVTDATTMDRGVSTCVSTASATRGTLWPLACAFDFALPLLYFKQHKERGLEVVTATKCDKQAL